MISLRICALLGLVLVTQNSGAAQRFRVITSNLWFSGTRGFDYVNNIYPLGHATSWPGIKRFMKRWTPSGYGIIGTQETDFYTNRTGKLNVPGNLASHLGSGWTYRYGATAPSDGGWTGNSVLTNAVVAKQQIWKFAFNKSKPADFGKHQRGAVALKLDFAGKRLWFVNTHFETQNRLALAQVFQLLGKIKTFDPDTPVIVVGDLNIMNGVGYSATEATFHKMAAAFSAAGFVDVAEKKYSRMPGAHYALAVADGQIDYIFVYDPHQRLTVHGSWSTRVMHYPQVYTDHFAVMADLEWK